MGETEVVCLTINTVISVAGAAAVAFAGAVKWAFSVSAKEARGQAEVLQAANEKLFESQNKLLDAVVRSTNKDG